MWSIWEVILIIVVAASFGGCIGLITTAIFFANRERE